MSHNNLDKKRERALRIMEALSGVDEELLERSGRENGATAQNGETVRNGEKTEKRNRREGAKLYRFVHRHGKLLAACLCLAVLGTAFWGLQRLEGFPYGSSKTTEAFTMDSAVDNCAPEAAEEMVAAGAQSNEEPEDAGEQQTTGATGMTGGTEAVKKEMAEMAVAEEDKSVQNSGANIPDEEISWEDAREPEGLGAYIPSKLPAGYREEYACRGTDSGRTVRLTLRWSNGKQDLQLGISEADWNEEIRFDAEPPVFTAEEDWKNLLPEPDEDGCRQFGLLLESGILVEYRGYLEKEEILEMFESIQ